MRETKFRALDRDIGEWFVLDIHELTNGETTAWCDVDMDTLGEFTGLKDKSGIEIFESDICKVNLADGRNIVATIGYRDACFELNFTAYIGRYGQDRDYLKCFVINHAVEVIGNIYENKELLDKNTGK